MIRGHYPDQYELYRDIYLRGDITYWMELEQRIEELSHFFDVPFVNFFYHDKIKKGG